MSDIYTNYSYRQLCQKHQHTKSIREKTRIEHVLWTEILSPKERKHHEQLRKFVQNVFGGSMFDAGNRHTLYNAGAEADPLWSRIEDGELKTTTALRLYREARKRAVQSGIPAADALVSVLREYDNMPLRADGVRTFNGMSNERRRKRKKQTRPALTAREFWQDLRDRIIGHVRAELPHSDMPESDRLWRQLETDIKIAVETFQARVGNAKKRAEKSQSATRRQLRAAFETLLLEPPRGKRPIDIEAVRKNKRRLAREYHPDMNDGDPNMVDAYQAVMEAAELIEIEWRRRKEQEQD